MERSNRVRAERLEADKLARPPRPCANSDCDELIPPSANGNTRYHDEKCRREARGKRYRAKYPDYQQTYRYDMEPGDYDSMLVAQGGRCAICGADAPGGKGGKFATDHDHATDEIRGLLCNSCNIALGHFGDDSDVLRKAIAYLKDPPARKR